MRWTGWRMPCWHARMDPGDLIEQARAYAGIDRAQLAERIGATEQDIELWETSELTPLSATLLAVNACGLELCFKLRPLDTTRERLLDFSAGLSERERQQLLESMHAFGLMLRLGGKPLEPPRRPDPYRLLEQLQRSKVRYVLMGELAEAVHGLPLRYPDVVIAPRPTEANLDKLERCLRAMSGELVDQPKVPPSHGTVWQDWVTHHAPVRLVFPFKSLETWGALETMALKVNLCGLKLRVADLSSLLLAELDHGYEDDEPPLLQRLRDSATGVDV